MLKKIILSILVILLCGCTNYKRGHDKTISISIDAIGMNHEVNISSINEEVNGIVMFDEYGRPNIENSNTIIGAHSGYGPNAIFNNISSLDIGDDIEIIYEEKIYKYKVEKNYEVDERDTYVLDSNNYSMLTLLSCKMSDPSKRIVVIARLNPNI
jgi:LPXTG-site transpeptidase (sortase) family protein